MQIEFVEKLHVANNNLIMNVIANIILILGYSLLFLVDWIEINDNNIQLEISILRTTVQPSK
jgi:hypothetical protein